MGGDIEDTGSAELPRYATLDPVDESKARPGQVDSEGERKGEREKEEKKSENWPKVQLNATFLIWF